MRVAGLWVYPVKSLGAVAVPEARVGARGLDGDRRWMFVDAGGRFLTQREHAVLALGRASPEGGGALTLAAPGLPPLRVAPPAADAPRVRVTVFGDVVDAAPAAPEAHAWATAWLGAPTRLVYMPDDVRRPVDPRYAGPGDHTTFTDGFPVLVASQTSLDDLNARLAAAGAAPVGIERFRPNVLLAADAGEALAPYAEDDWRALRLGGGADAVGLAVVKPCARCVVTTIDQASAARGKEPLRTLAGYRRRGSKVLFAQNAVVRAPGVVRVGDPAAARC
ncbi:MOSC domain-containing protein [Gemmatimonadetes bacterium T265]|nr:MOSC domain-containing protein [Gemmatimonadetes bacterium T265]